MDNLLVYIPVIFGCGFTSAIIDVLIEHFMMSTGDKGTGSQGAVGGSQQQLGIVDSGPPIIPGGQVSTQKQLGISGTVFLQMGFTS